MIARPTKGAKSREANARTTVTAKPPASGSADATRISRSSGSIDEPSRAGEVARRS